MRLLRLAVTTAAVVTPVLAFAPQVPHVATASYRREALPGLRIKIQLLAEASDATGEGFRLPPKDETFGPVGRIRELLAAPEAACGAERYDRIGGTWRTYQYGYLPATVSSPRTLIYSSKQKQHRL